MNFSVNLNIEVQSNIIRCIVFCSYFARKTDEIHRNVKFSNDERSIVGRPKMTINIPIQAFIRW